MMVYDMLEFRRRVSIGFTLILLLVVVSETAAEQELPELSAQLKRIYAGRAPKTADDLRAMQEHQQLLAKRVIAATVSVQVGNAFGSGVIVSPDGLVLSAAHVAGEPGRRALVRLSDGRLASAISLGVHRPLDAGMLRITDQSDVTYLACEP